MSKERGWCVYTTWECRAIELAAESGRTNFFFVSSFEQEVKCLSW